MNDTPRTNAILTAILETHGHVGFLNCPPAWVAFSKELERELNAANQRIKQLEEANDRIKRLEAAGDELASWSPSITHASKWRKAKEDKP